MTRREGNPTSLEILQGIASAGKPLFYEIILNLLRSVDAAKGWYQAASPDCLGHAGLADTIALIVLLHD
jgi:hypothetical protein